MAGRLWYVLYWSANSWLGEQKRKWGNDSLEEWWALCTASWLHWNPIFRGEWQLNPQWWGLVSSYGVLLSVVNPVEKNAQSLPNLLLPAQASVIFAQPWEGGWEEIKEETKTKKILFLSAYSSMQNSLCKLESATGLLGSWQWHCQCAKVKVWVKLREGSLLKLFLNNQYKHAVHPAWIALASYVGSFRQSGSLSLFYAAQNSACGFFKARFSFSPAFQGHIWEIIIGRAEKGCCMNHERWSVCQSPAGCTTLNILCSNSVTWRGLIHDLKQLSECDSLKAMGFTSPGSSPVFPSPPRSHPSYSCPTVTTTCWYKMNRK